MYKSVSFVAIRAVSSGYQSYIFIGGKFSNYMSTTIIESASVDSISRVIIGEGIYA